jgi:DNA-binding response OmpR family regulator
MKKKILIVDDEALILDSLGEMFRKKSYEVFLSSRGDEAFDIFKKENIKVIFLDLKLPDMTGIDLCIKIKKNNPLVLIYAMTGYGSLFQLVDCREAGFDDYFLKPVNLSILHNVAEKSFETLKRWMER